MVNAELSIRVRDMALDRGQADHQWIGDLLITHAGRDETQNLEVTCGKRLAEAGDDRRGRCCFGVRAIIESSQQPLDIWSSDAIPDGVAKKLVHGRALVDKDPHVAFGPGECHCTSERYQAGRD